MFNGQHTKGCDGCHLWLDSFEGPRPLTGAAVLGPGEQLPYLCLSCAVERNIYGKHTGGQSMKQP